MPIYGHRFYWHVDEKSNSTQEIIEKTKNGIPSLPSSLKIEHMINPFIRCNEENLIDNINKKFGEVSSEIEIFSTLRKWKDDF